MCARSFWLADAYANYVGTMPDMRDCCFQCFFKNTINMYHLFFCWFIQVENGKHTRDLAVSWPGRSPYKMAYTLI